MRKLPFQLTFYKDRIPSWPCPACNTGVLTLNPKSWCHEETAESLRDHSHEAWEPEWIRYVFSCMLFCNNTSCKEPVSCCGFGQIEEEQYLDHSNKWCRDHVEIFTPTFFQPNLLLMEIPPNCPAEVCTHMHKSFALYFTDPSASLNCARTAIEAVLTNLGIDGSNKASLHKRIQLLPEEHAELADLLLAAKWLGNSGSHEGEQPTTADVQMAYSLLEYVLSEIYEKKTEKLREIAKRVNEKKGPIT